MKKRVHGATVVAAEKTVREKSAFLLFCERFTAVYLLLLAGLLPLKFGQLAMMAESPGFFPPEWSDFLFVSWPSNTFGVLSGFGLLLTLAVFSRRAALPRTLFFWLLVLLLSLFGAVNASTADAVWLLFGHLCGIVAFIAAVSILLDAAPENRERLLNVFAASALLVVMMGVHQYFWGFEQQRQYFEQYGAPDTLRVNADFVNKLYENRVFSTLASCNTLAGYLLLTGFLLAARVWRWGGTMEPQLLWRGIGTVPAAAAVLFVLYATGSRAAMGMLVVALWLTLFALARTRKARIAAAGAGIAAGITAAAVLLWFSGRGLESMGERLLYWRSAFAMMLEHPFCGSGWGDFFYDHMMLKGASANDEAARWPHNIVLTFGSQSGVLAMLAFLAAVLWPLWRAWRRLRAAEDIPEKVSFAALFAGAAAFFGHSLFDVNFQIPASMATFGVFLLFLDGHGASEAPRWRRFAANSLLWMLAASAIVLSVYLLAGEYHLDRLQQLCRGGGGHAAIKDEFEELERLRPYSPYHQLEFGDYLLRRELPELAEVYFMTALTRSPERPSTYYRLSLCRYGAGDRAKSREYLMEAVRRFPAGRDYRKALEDFK